MLAKIQWPDGTDAYMMGRQMLELWLRWELVKVDWERNIWILTDKYIAACN